ncbi:MAG: hypothetical protein CMK76_07275 [Pseudomonadales bacterium]|nr:hypothetical protein [Pseudomonadales bacterium]|tara:strand:- start:11682 stop:12710 length:1029 start_codon:yes stop_codon:yes gene_type:complete
MAIRTYTHETFSGSVLYSVNNLQGNLRRVIAECLVNGSGGEPAAGWHLEYDVGGDTGTFVVSNAARDFFVCFNYVNGTTTKVSLAASFEGVDAGGFIVGEAARSGREGGFASPHLLNAQNFLVATSSSSGRQGGWSILADEDSCAIVWSIGSSELVGAAMDTSASGMVRYGGGLSFGKTTAGYPHVSGHMLTNYQIHPAVGVMVMHYAASGLLAPSADTMPVVGAGVDAAHSGGANTGADFVYEDLLLTPIEVYQQGNAAVGAASLGAIRGFVQAPHVDLRLYPRHILNALGMAGADFDTMRYQDLSKLRVGDDGYRYAYGKQTSGMTAQAQMFLTDNPAVW